MNEKDLGGNTFSLDADGNLIWTCSSSNIGTRNSITDYPREPLTPAMTDDTLRSAGTFIDSFAGREKTEIALKRQATIDCIHDHLPAEMAGEHARLQYEECRKLVGEMSD